MGVFLEFTKVIFIKKEVLRSVLQLSGVLKYLFYSFHVAFNFKETYHDIYGKIFIVRIWRHRRRKKLGSKESHRSYSHP